VTKLDRLARSLPIAEDLTKRKVRLSLARRCMTRPTRSGGCCSTFWRWWSNSKPISSDLALARACASRRPRAIAGQAAQTQPASGSPPGRTAAHRRILHCRTRRPVRRRAFHRLPRRRPQQEGSGLRPHRRREAVSPARHAEADHQRRQPQLGDHHLPAATRCAERDPIGEPPAYARTICAPGQRTPNGTLNLSHTAPDEGRNQNAIRRRTSFGWRGMAVASG
jgi:hypothetical protein